MFLIWFFNCFYLCPVIKVALIINRKTLALLLHLSFSIGVISIKCLQSPKFKMKCYRCFNNFKFSEYIKKKFYKLPSTRISKPKQLNVFNILVLFMIAPFFLYFLNHSLVFFVALFEFSLKLYPHLPKKFLLFTSSEAL